jgi:hypothetical protein
METGESNSKLIIKEKDFNDNNIENYHLSLEISHQTISYCIIDTNKRRCKLLFSSKYDNNNLVEFINGDKYLSQDFQSISVAIVNSPNTLVPISLYKEKDKYDLFSLNHDLDDVILDDNIKNEIKNLYAVPESLNNTLNNLFPNAKIRSQSSILINNFLNHQNNKEYLYLYVKDNFVNIILTKNDELIFQNKFSYQTKEDLLFYTLFCIQELNLSNEEIKTDVYGDISKEEFNILYEYIRNIDYGNKLKDIECSNEFYNIKTHCFSILYRQHLCV